MCSGHGQHTCMCLVSPIFFFFYKKWFVTHSLLHFYFLELKYCPFSQMCLFLRDACVPLCGFHLACLVGFRGIYIFKSVPPRMSTGFNPYAYIACVPETLF